MAPLAGTNLLLCLFFIGCFCLTGELTDKVIFAFVSSLILYFSSKGVFFF